MNGKMSSSPFASVHLCLHFLVLTFVWTSQELVFGGMCLNSLKIVKITILVWKFD